MTTPATRRRILGTIAAAAIATALAAGCGSDARNVQSVVSFGDSLSDLGTYRWGPVEAAGGGKYTTNPGPVWVEHVATHYGLAISRNRSAGVGNPSPQIFGGLGYAQGGARVSLPLGIGSTPSGVPEVPIEATAMPVRDQISAHLLAQGRIPPSQMVLVQAGGNDLFYQLLVFAQAVQGGGSPLDAQQVALQQMIVAGSELAGEIGRLVAAGAEKVVLVDLPDPSISPFGTSLPELAPLMSAMTQAFNQTVAAGVAGVAGVQRIDINAFLANVFANPAGYGFTDTAGMACTVPTVDDPLPLYCTSATLVAPNAANTYFFADDVHPSAGGHLQIARHVIASIAAAIPQ
jgi:outer membrane lipase/esterase